MRPYFKKTHFSESTTTGFYVRFQFSRAKVRSVKKHEICASQSGQVYVDFEGQSKARLKVVPLFYTQLQKALKISLYSDVTHKGKKNEHTCVLCIV